MHICVGTNLEKKSLKTCILALKFLSDYNTSTNYGNQVMAAFITRLPQVMKMVVTMDSCHNLNGISLHKNKSYSGKIIFIFFFFFKVNDVGET